MVIHDHLELSLKIKQDYKFRLFHATVARVYRTRQHKLRGDAEVRQLQLRPVRAYTRTMPE